MEGAQRLLSEDRLQELTQIGDLMQVLERRVALLSLLQEALEERSVYLRIGEENQAPELRSVSVVVANYGLPTRNLGALVDLLKACCSLSLQSRCFANRFACVRQAS